jgi:hypothetical protein
MAIHIGEYYLDSNVNDVRLIPPSLNSTIFSSSNGSIIKNGTPSFQATSSNGWVYHSSWQTQTFNEIIYNNGNCFNGTLFTAPVKGSYFFSYQSYALKDTSGVGRYWHPLFSVNGSATNVRLGGSGSTNYRMRSYNNPTDYDDLQIDDILYLQAGDNVQVTVFSSHSNNRLHGQYSFFSGALLG